MTPRLAIVATHPVQYYAPLFKRVASRGAIDIHVFYGWEGLSRGGHDVGFARQVEWDVPLIDGYESTFIRNESRAPGTHHPRGIVGRDLVPAIERWSPDAVLVIGWAYVSHFAALRAFHGRLPILFRGDSTLIGERPGPKKWLRRAALRFVYGHVDLALYVGVHNRRYFRAHGLRDDQLAWMPAAVAHEYFADTDGAHTRDASSWRARLGIPHGAPTAVFAGKLEAKKAPGLLLQAFMTHARPDAHLVFAGSGDLETTLRQTAAGRPNIHFVGFQNQTRMPATYRLGDVYVLPSRGTEETWGLAVNEAMTCGLPVIVSDQVGCAPDLVEGKNTGIVFRSADGNALGRALQHLLDDRQLSARMGAASRSLIDAWSIDVAAERLEQSTAGLRLR